MRYAAPVVLLSGFVAFFVACEKNSEPDCRDEQCTAVDGGVPPDGASVTPADDGASPEPFDAGVVNPAPTCKGLFELCSGFDCCSPYGCTNGTCR